MYTNLNFFFKLRLRQNVYVFRMGGFEKKKELNLPPPNVYV